MLFLSLVIEIINQRLFVYHEFSRPIPPKCYEFIPYPNIELKKKIAVLEHGKNYNLE